MLIAANALKLEAAIGWAISRYRAGVAHKAIDELVRRR
jgi:hypothetical protein